MIDLNRTKLRWKNPLEVRSYPLMMSTSIVQSRIQGSGVAGGLHAGNPMGRPCKEPRIIFLGGYGACQRGGKVSPCRYTCGGLRKSPCSHGGRSTQVSEEDNEVLLSPNMWGLFEPLPNRNQGKEEGGAIRPPTPEGQRLPEGFFAWPLEEQAKWWRALAAKGETSSLACHPCLPVPCPEPPLEGRAGVKSLFQRVWKGFNRFTICGCLCSN
ncbi:uncharacterized protein LOC114839544 [Esox lucius]|uniref:uncharacterized protein LOC114839544 n=1 Tax=Esox lucius TaxID=8010 RepID=UPI0014768F41|nr:uncharacterized protein LOC114839544 [Esox lucius]